MNTSTAYILVKGLGYRYTFDGVVSVSHNLSLKISTDSDAEEGTDYVNNARNEPDVVTLSVVASDSHVPVAGWARQTLSSLCQIKELRLLCQVFTSLRMYDNMLLSDLSVQQDETCPEGWVGTLTFTQAESASSAEPVNDYSSTATYSSSVSARSVGSSATGGGGGSVLQTILREAGING